MDYPFPNVQKQCPYCSAPDCARWKGYFRRTLVCSALGFEGKIAIHIGQCRTRGCDFSYWPDFLIPRRRLSRWTLQWFYETWADLSCQVKGTIDVFLDKVETVETLALSTAYSWFYFLIRVWIVHQEALRVRPPSSVSVVQLRVYKSEQISSLFEHWCYWHPSKTIIFPPPE